MQGKSVKIVAPNHREYNVLVKTPILYDPSQTSACATNTNEIPMFDPHSVQEIKEFFEDFGFVVIAGNVSTSKNRTDLKQLMVQVAQEQPNAIKSGFLELTHDHALAELRQDTLMYKVFANLFGTDKLWSVFDRVIYHPPNSEPELLNPHVDQSPVTHPDFYAVQGMLALEAMNEFTGTLALIPTSQKWFHVYAHWAKGNEQFIENQAPQLPPMTALCVPEGALIIWDSRTTHSRYWGIQEKQHRKPRFAALITYMVAPNPEDEKTQEWIAIRKECFLAGISKNNHEAGMRATAAPRYEASLRKRPEQLTSLGRKLYGVEPW